MEAEALTIRSLNDSKSAFIAVELQPSFFDAFLLTNRREPFSCRVSSKAICAIMRNLKTLRYLLLSAEVVGGAGAGAEHVLSFQFAQQSGLLRSHHFHYMDAEILNAVFDEDGCSYLKVRPKVLSQLLEHLHRSPEVLLVAAPDSFGIRSFHANSSTSSSHHQQQQPMATASASALQQLSTGLTIQSGQFEVYDFLFRSTAAAAEGAAGAQQLQQAEELVLSVRELAAVVGYCEALEAADADVFFSTGGRALKCSSKQDLISVTLVLATMAHAPEEEDKHKHTQPPLPAPAAPAHAPAAAEQEEEEDVHSARGTAPPVATPAAAAHADSSSVPAGDRAEEGVPVAMAMSSSGTVSTSDGAGGRMRRKKHTHMHARKRMLEDSSDDEGEEDGWRAGCAV